MISFKSKMQSISETNFRNKSECVGVSSVCKGIRSRSSCIRVQNIGQKSGGKKMGFKFDAANLRWVRDDKYADVAVPKIQPLTGPEYTVWPVMYETLKELGIKSVDAAEAQKLMKRGYTLVDVRLAADYDKLHAADALSVPLFRPVQGKGFYDNLKRVAMGAFAMQATERNPEFVNDLSKLKKKGDKLIVMCAVGGTLKDTLDYFGKKSGYKDPDRQFGRESRSLKAIYELVTNGYKNVVHLDGGLNQWKFDGYPVEGTNVRN
eukprot:TRINITY_DN14669_c1_g1_i2.p2 TRINITY_DN14669_c1_g1~~TRINITY_DN14669_c1_g1_i2.p2  ORF type:complete len:273 (-),score=24.76 TRINITY_DN14669_c1_g1_i2:257-1045(-)